MSVISQEMNIPTKRNERSHEEKRAFPLGETVVPKRRKVQHIIYQYDKALI